MLSGEAHVVVVFECRTDQILQLGFMENLCPFLVAERVLIWTGRRGFIRTAINRGGNDLRTHIFWSHPATGHEEKQRR
jgi:hypothetical protein